MRTNQFIAIALVASGLSIMACNSGVNSAAPSSESSSASSAKSSTSNSNNSNLGAGMGSIDANSINGFWADSSNQCQPSSSWNVSNLGEIQIQSVRNVVKVAWPNIYSAYLFFEAADCSGQGIEGLQDPNTGIWFASENSTNFFWWQDSFGTPSTEMTGVPETMIVSLVLDDANQMAKVKMFSYIVDAAGVVHISLFGNQRSYAYFSENSLDVYNLQDWPGDADPKFSNAISNPLGYMDLTRIDN